MADRASLFRGTQISIEPTPGTAGTALRKLPSLTITPQIVPNMSLFKPRGYKAPTVARPGKESTTATVAGPGSYNETIYPLTGIFGSPIAVTTPDAVGAASVRLWQWEWNTVGAQNVRTFTVEDGSTQRAMKFNYGFFTEFGETYTRDEINMSGAMVGRRVQDGTVMSATPSTVELVPMQANEVNIYLANSYSFSDSDLLTRAISASWMIRNTAAPTWFLNRTDASFTSHVETDPETEVRLRLSADDVGMGLLNTMRAGARKYLRIYALGPLAQGALSYYSIRDMCVLVTGVSPIEDEDETILAIEWTMQIARDTNGFAMRAYLRNRQSGL